MSGGQQLKWWLRLTRVSWPPGLLGELVERGLVETIVDLYRLKESDLVGKSCDAAAAAMAHAALHGHAKPSFHHFLNGLEMDAATSARALELEGYDLGALLSAQPEDLASVDDMGLERAQKIVSEVQARRDELAGLLELGIVPAPPAPRVEPDLARKLSRPVAKVEAPPRASELRERWGFAPPDDFFAFWDFAQKLNPPSPERCLSDTLGIDLVGAFDVLSGKLQDAPLPLTVHWRSYLDPPEMFTVLSGEIDGEHWGYWLDDPASSPSWVASFFNRDAFDIHAPGRTLFDAVRDTLELSYSDAHDNDEPERIERIDQLRESLMEYATSDRPERGQKYMTAYRHPFSQLRLDAITAPTLDGMGIVVPPSSYARPRLMGAPLRDEIHETDGFRAIAEAREALSASLPGKALALAKALWTEGRKYRDISVELSAAAYRALERPFLADVIETHHATWREGSITFADRKD